jgi:hypothetical protein
MMLPSPGFPALMTSYVCSHQTDILQYYIDTFRTSSRCAVASAEERFFKDHGLAPDRRGHGHSALHHKQLKNVIACIRQVYQINWGTE